MVERANKIDSVKHNEIHSSRRSVAPHRAVFQHYWPTIKTTRSSSSCCDPWRANCNIRKGSGSTITATPSPHAPRRGWITDPRLPTVSVHRKPRRAASVAFVSQFDRAGACRYLAARRLRQTSIPGAFETHLSAPMVCLLPAPSGSLTTANAGQDSSKAGCRHSTTSAVAMAA